MGLMVRMGLRFKVLRDEHTSIRVTFDFVNAAFLIAAISPRLRRASIQTRRCPGRRHTAGLAILLLVRRTAIKALLVLLVRQ